MSDLLVHLQAPANWDDQIAALPGAHVLQTNEWAQVKAANGWRPLYCLWPGAGGHLQAAALVMERAVSPLRLKVLYAPRGPLLDWGDPKISAIVLNDLQQLARKRGAIFVKIDPEVQVGTGISGDADARPCPEGLVVQAELEKRSWRLSSEQIQFRNTVWIDLFRTEEERLAHLKQKWRYNLRLAQRKGVSVRACTDDDLPGLYRMYAETSVRDGFVIRPEEYYLNVWRRFMRREMATPLVAEADGQVIAGLVLFHFAGRAWYLYGMSRQLHREKMPNYLLQWRAMQVAASLGCRTYDLWGAPDIFDEKDPMWGVFRFKEGMGGRVIRLVGAWDFPVRPWLYSAYTRLLPRLLDILRRRGQAQTQREVSL
jgi:peptidoglycan pentaglycine glycine transferase (the first glycine)